MKEAEALVEGTPPKKKGTVELTHEEASELLTLLLRERLSDTEESLFSIQLRESQRIKLGVAKDKAVFMAKIGSRVGGKIREAKVVGKSTLSYELE